MSSPPIKIIRSSRRKKTVSARLHGGELLIYLPAKLSKREEEEWIAKMKEKVMGKTRRLPQSDDYLLRRAKELNKRFFDGKLSVNSIRFVDNQRKRHGSCSTLRGTIRISNRLGYMPRWVLDYVIVHELAHLVHPDHSKAFWKLVNQYKYSERARGFLIAKDLEDLDGSF